MSGSARSRLGGRNWRCADTLMFRWRLTRLTKSDALSLSLVPKRSHVNGFSVSGRGNNSSAWSAPAQWRHLKLQACHIRGFMLCSPLLESGQCYSRKNIRRGTARRLLTAVQSVEPSDTCFNRREPGSACLSRRLMANSVCLDI